MNSLSFAKCVSFNISTFISTPQCNVMPTELESFVIVSLLFSFLGLVFFKVLHVRLIFSFYFFYGSFFFSTNDSTLVNVAWHWSVHNMSNETCGW
jgi:hypothetical protein